jgi:photosystem II stability/assembly factor-like uncharacterized protein
VKKITITFLFFFTLYSTINAQWNKIKTSTTGTIYDMTFINDSTGFFVGDGVFKTINYGDTWNSIDLSPSGERIFFYNDTIGYVLSYKALYKTINGGKTWNEVYDFTKESTHFMASDIVFTTEKVGYMVAYISGPPGGSYIYKTTNGGNNWSISGSFPSIMTLQSIDFFNAENGIAVGLNGQIIKTTDAGTTWTVQQTNSFGTFLSVYLINNIGYTSGYASSGSEIIKTTDGGKTWLQQATNGTGNSALRTVFFPTEDIGYAAGENGKIVYTIDGGTSWQVSEPTIPETFFSSYFITPKIGFIGGTNGTLLKTTNGGIGGITVGVPVIKDLKDHLEDIRVSPNPVNRFLSIKNIPNDQYVLTVTNMEGNKLLVKKVEIGGSFELELKGFSNGNYFLTLQNSKERIVKKIIVRK